MNDSKTITCPRCKGAGVVPDREVYQDGCIMDNACPACEGEGWFDIEDDEDDSNIPLGSVLGS